MDHRPELLSKPHILIIVWGTQKVICSASVSYLVYPEILKISFGARSSCKNRANLPNSFQPMPFELIDQAKPKGQKVESLPNPNAKNPHAPLHLDSYPPEVRQVQAVHLRIWLWVKNSYPKWNPGTWKHGPSKPASHGDFILTHTHVGPVAKLGAFFGWSAPRNKKVGILFGTPSKSQHPQRKAREQK